jgi:catechol 2,3-dioxygenase-like lactoylglutathione lyase family enzyme
MSVSISTVHVLVDDHEAAVAFYRDALGMAVQHEVANQGFRWVTLATESQPEVQIVLSQPQAGRSEEDGETLAALLAKGELGTVNFRTENLDATFEKVAAAPGAEVLEEPADRPWGARDAAVRDPAGNHVRIEQA